MLEFEISYLDILKGVVITQVCIQLKDGFFNPTIFVMKITHVHQINSSVYRVGRISRHVLY